MNWREIIAWVMVREGGLNNTTGDPGGLTNFGITETYLMAMRVKWTDMNLPQTVADLTPVQAMELYRRDEWVEVKGDALLAQCGWPIALMLMDAAVNNGPVLAITLLQRAVKTPVDGKMGPITLAAIHKAGALLLAKFAARRGADYAVDDSKEDRFELGWMNRLIACYTRALQP
jgi:lysozyme family protein